MEGVVRAFEITLAFALLFVAATTLASLLVLGEHPSWWRSVGLACGTLGFALRLVVDVCR